MLTAAKEAQDLGARPGVPTVLERMELSKPELQPTLERLRKIARSGTLTLLYAKRDTQHNNAVVLKEVLEEGL